MGLRFYRRIPIIPGVLWLNISKKGFSFSIGQQGWRITRNRNGTLFTLGLTGTGLFWSKFYPRSKAIPPSTEMAPELSESVKQTTDSYVEKE